MGLLAADADAWPVYVTVLVVLTLLWPCCVQLAPGVEIYFPVTWAAAASTYLIGPPALFVIWASATLGYLLIGVLDRLGLVEAKGLAAWNLRRAPAEQVRLRSNVHGLLRQFVYLGGHAIRAAATVAARALAPGVSIFVVVLAAEGLVTLWTRIVPVPAAAAPRTTRRRFAAALGRDLLVATDLVHVGIVCFLIMSWERGGPAGFVAASLSTVVLHVILKGQNDLRIESERQRLELISMSKELERRQRMAVIGQTASKVFHQIARHHGSVGIFAHLLSRGPGDGASSAELARWAETVRDHAVRILGSVEEANRVMDELLRFGQDRALNLYPQPLAEVVEECVRDCRPQAVRRGVPVTVGEAPPATVVLDKYKIVQAVGNLIDNALEVTPPGGHVEVVPGVNGSSVSIAVRDYGPGVPAAVHATLFTPFCTTKPEGVGLGLALAKELVEAHGGTIEWRSAGPGTVFVVTLPREPRATD
jgi:signal transduction histidine kinase